MATPVATVLFLVSCFSLVLSATVVVEVGGKVTVNGEPFSIRGVKFSPPHSTYWRDTTENREEWENDIQLVRSLGANTILLSNFQGDITPFLDACHKTEEPKLFVMLQFSFPLMDLTKHAQKLAQTFQSQLLEPYHNHPALLMWVVGRDLNAPWNYSLQERALVLFVQQLAALAHNLEKGAHQQYHPVVASLLDDGAADFIAKYEESMLSVDVWGFSVHRGIKFSGFFDDTYSATDKAIVVLGFGVDAFDSSTQSEDQEYQAKWDVSLVEELSRICTVHSQCAGGVLAEFRDDWTADDPTGESDCSLDPLEHSACGYEHLGMPDGVLNPQWFGLVARPGEGHTGTVLRKAYAAVQSFWTSHPVDEQQEKP